MRFTALARAVAALLLLLLPAVGAAAQRTGTRTGRTARVGNADDAELAMAMMARCIAVRRPEFVQRWLITLPGTPQERDLVNGELDDMTNCLDDDRLVMDSRTLRFERRALRRPVALATVERGLARAPASAPVPPESEPWFVPLIAGMSPQTQLDRGSLAVQDFGHCVALRAWADTRALFATRASSEEESAAVRRLAPALGPCLTEGVSITITHRNLRLLLAEPFYHLMTGAPPGAAAPNR
jgi:hypothetical protein